MRKKVRSVFFQRILLLQTLQVSFYLSSLGMWIVDVPEQTSLVGASVGLPCNIAPSSPDDSVILIFWYRNESVKPLYAVDARSVSLDKARHSPDESLASRVAFHISFPVSYFRLSPVREQDEGEYRCRVDFKRERTRNTIIRLKVIVPVTDVQIRDEDGNVFRTKAGPFNEDSQVTLVCQSTGGNPRPMVRWWNGSTLMDDSYTYAINSTTLNSITITLQRTHHSKNLTCEAISSNLTTPLLKTITIDLNLKPKEVTLVPASNKLSSGRLAQFVCTSRGSKPPAQLHWTRGDKEIYSTTELDSHGLITKTSLSIIPSHEDHNKQLACLATNPNIPGFHLSDSFTMNVHYPPVLSLVLGASAQLQYILEGSQVYFQCNTQANPSIYEFGWTFENKSLTSDKLPFISISNYTLTIKSVIETHSGSYQCWARNSEGRGESEVVQLRVKYGPKCIENQRKYYGIDKEDVIILCTLIADPANVTFAWSFGEETAEADSGEESRTKPIRFTSKGSASLATISPEDARKYRKIYCRGRNSVGTQVKPCVFHFIPVGKPDSPENCTINNNISNSVNIECIPGFNGGLRQRFHLEIFMDVKSKQTLLHNLTAPGEEPYFSVFALPPDTSLLFYIYSSNVKGQSPRVALSLKTLQASKWRSDSEELHSIPTLVSILISCALFPAIILIVLVIKFLTGRKPASKRAGPRVGSAEESLPTIKITEDETLHTCEDSLEEEKAIQKLGVIFIKDHCPHAHLFAKTSSGTITRMATPTPTTLVTDSSLTCQSAEAIGETFPAISSPIPLSSLSVASWCTESTLSCQACCKNVSASGHLAISRHCGGDEAGILEEDNITGDQVF